MKERFFRGACWRGTIRAYEKASEPYFLLLSRTLIQFDALILICLLRKGSSSYTLSLKCPLWRFPIGNWQELEDFKRWLPKNEHQHRLRRGIQTPADCCAPVDAAVT